MAPLPDPDAVARALAAHQVREHPALPGRTNHVRAGVLVPLRWGTELEVVLTLRPPRLREHASEISFPGGRPEAGDRDLAATARREAHEELGISDARLLGRLSSMPVFTSDHRLVPYVAEIPPVALTPNPAEVAAVVEASVAEVLARPYIDAIPFQIDAIDALSPVFVLGDLAVFGATAQTLAELLGVIAPLCGCALPPLRPGRFDWAQIAMYRAHAPRHG